MCIAAAPLALIAAGMSAAGTVAGGIQANAQGKVEAAAAKQNAILATQAARESIETGKDEARTYWREVAQTKGNQTAAMAANGLDMSFGTPLRVAEDTVMLSREDADNLYSNIDKRTKGFIIDASNYVQAAKAAKAQGKAKLIGSIIEGGATLISGAAQYKGARQKLGPPGWR